MTYSLPRFTTVGLNTPFAAKPLPNGSSTGVSLRRFHVPKGSATVLRAIVAAMASPRDNIAAPGEGAVSSASIVANNIACREVTLMRRFLAVLALSAVACARPSTQAPQPLGDRWLATWTASPYDAPRRPPRDSVDRTPTLVNLTLRLIVRTSIAGDRIRIRL